MLWIYLFLINFSHVGIQKFLIHEYNIFFGMMKIIIYKFWRHKNLQQLSSIQVLEKWIEFSS